MDSATFAKLEERIKKMVSHIEMISGQNGDLLDENKELKIRVTEIEKKMKQLEKDTSKVSESIKDKVERLLGRIESFEKSVG